MTFISKVIKYVIATQKKLCYSLIKNRIEGKRTGRMKKNYTAMEIAQWFLWFNLVQKNQEIDDDENYDVYEGFTHLKIQKLLYFSEGVYSAIKDHSLYKEKIYAWQHGPVVKEVYSVFSKYGRNELEFDKKYWDSIKKINDDADVSEILEMVYFYYAGFTAWQLREKSHIVGGPWQITVDTKGMSKEIEKNLIKNFFKNNVIKNEQ